MGRMTLITGEERRRRWSDEDRGRILAAINEPGAVIADVARRADVCTSLVYKWRPDARQAAGAPGFARVIVDDADAGGGPASCRQRHLQDGERPGRYQLRGIQEVYLDAYRSGCKGCTTYRPNAITGSVLEVKPTEPASAPPAAPESDQTVDLLRRAEKLTGATYKLKWPDSEHAMYVTVNDIEVDGARRPFEVFVNSKNLEHYASVVALTRMISAVFRRGDEVAFVAEELKQVFDPRGGQWSNGRYVGSLVAAIGDIIERHMVETGFLKPAEAPPGKLSHATSPSGAASPGPLCPKCSQPGLVREAGCLSCIHCGWSKCS